MTDENLIIPYINHRGCFCYRQILPTKISFQESNKYHGKNCHILTAVDVDKQEFRDYDMVDIIKGVIEHTLESIGVDITKDEVDNIYYLIEENYKENDCDKE
jgi:hypothetical protein